MAITRLNNNSITSITALPSGVGGKILQVVTSSTNSQLGANNQDTDTFNFERSITLSSASNKVLAICNVNAMSNGGGGRMSGKLLWNTTSGGTSGTQITLTQIANDSFDTNGMSSLTLVNLFSPNTTDTTYVKNIIAKNDSGTQWYVQRYSNYSYMTLMEILN